jgi:hypothetical protein
MLTNHKLSNDGAHNHSVQQKDLGKMMTEGAVPLPPWASEYSS